MMKSRDTYERSPKTLTACDELPNIHRITIAVALLYRRDRALLKASDQGHDVALAAPFRPDHPTQIYEPHFSRTQESYGGDIWIHMRVFRKELFDEFSDGSSNSMVSHLSITLIMPQ